MSIASVAAQQSQAAAASSSASTSSTSGTSALSSLSGNMNSFLQMLMTQLQNQDPTSPMDPNAYTTELVQFSGVQQQINTNTSLTQLIQLTQGSEMLQASSIVGKTVTLNSTQLPLQNGSASLQFTAPTAEPVTISVYNSSGTAVRNVSLQANAGSNSWTWNGTSDSGTTLPDGAYTVAVAGGLTGSTPSALSFTVNGTVTGVSTANNAVQLQLGTMQTSMGNVQQVGN